MTEFPFFKISALITLLIGTHIVVWVISVITYTEYLPNGIALLIIAYTLGLRHALDADHIAAIDNVTRRMVQNGEFPTTVGLYFSLGHSTIVIAASIIVASLSSTILDVIDEYGSTGTIGASISATFLLIICVINSVSIFLIVRGLKRMKTEPDIEWQEILQNSGFFSRIFGDMLFKVIDKPWKMYIIGFLFGLGFDTATEVALLGIVALQTSTASGWLILFFPLLFTCGMTLVDTLDGMLMLGAYGWGEVSHLKKVYYNLLITSVSCIFAFCIATIEILGIAQSNLGVGNDDDSSFWSFIAEINSKTNFMYIGMSLLVSFVIGWFICRFIFNSMLKQEQLPHSVILDDVVEAEVIPALTGAAVRDSIHYDGDGPPLTFADPKHVISANTEHSANPSKPAALL